MSNLLQNKFSHDRTQMILCINLALLSTCTVQYNKSSKCLNKIMNSKILSVSVNYIVLLKVQTP